MTSRHHHTEPPAADEQAGYPVIEWLEGQPVPDLNETPQARWREVLIPLTKRARAIAAYRVRMPEASREAGILTVTLDLEDGDRRAQATSRAARPPTMRGVEHTLWEERQGG